MKNLLRIFRIQRLHVFADDYTTWVIAFDPFDAMNVWEEWSGDTWDNIYDPLDRQVNDHKIISISCEPDDFEDFKKHRPPFSKVSNGKGDILPFISAPAWLWCLWNGRGFLCSTES